MKGDSLKNKLFDAVRNAYPDMFSLSSVEDLAKQEGRKISNAERRLRELCDGEDPWIIPVRNEKKYIMGYIYKEPVRKINFGGIPKIEKELSELDERLTILLEKIPKREAWQYGEVIRQINEALKSTYENTKKRVLDNYEDKF